MAKKKKKKLPTSYRVTGFMSFVENDEHYPREVKNVLKLLIENGCLAVTAEALD